MAKKKRLIIPIDFQKELLEELVLEAKAIGLPTSTYIRFLLANHPGRPGLPVLTKKKQKKRMAK